jgi:hypothetical protein
VRIFRIKMRAMYHLLKIFSDFPNKGILVASFETEGEAADYIEVEGERLKKEADFQSNNKEYQVTYSLVKEETQNKSLEQNFNGK